MMIMSVHNATDRRSVLACSQLVSRTDPRPASEVGFPVPSLSAVRAAYSSPVVSKTYYCWLMTRRKSSPSCRHLQPAPLSIKSKASPNATRSQAFCLRDHYLWKLFPLVAVRVFVPQQRPFVDHIRRQSTNIPTITEQHIPCLTEAFASRTYYPFPLHHFPLLTRYQLSPNALVCTDRDFFIPASQPHHTSPFRLKTQPKLNFWQGSDPP